MGYRYTKLFEQILESTIWCESDSTRVVWITMLAMADKDGEVLASIPGLAKRANVSLDQCQVALERFQQPDEFSRTPEYEGRRIAPVEGGWMLLNHHKYRDLMDSEAEKERKRKWWEEHRGKGAKLAPPSENSQELDELAQASTTTTPATPAVKTLNPLVPQKRDGGQKGNGKSKFNPEALQYLDFLNAKAGKHFRPVLSNLRLVEARLAEGVTLQDLKTLTVRKCREWLGTAQEKYLRPETLCNATKCQSYLGEIAPEVPCNAPAVIEVSSPQQNPVIADGQPLTDREASAVH